MLSEPTFKVILAGFVILSILTFAVVASAVKAARTWKSGWVILAICSLGLVTGFLGYMTLKIGRDSVGREALSTGVKVFKSEDGLSAITTPSFWTKTLSGPEDASLRVGSLTNNEYLVVITEPKSDFAEGFTVRNYGAAVTQAISNPLNDLNATEFGEFQLNGLKAIRNEISGSISDEPIEYFNTYIEGKAHFHQIRCWTPGQNRSAAFPRLRQVADTFHELTR